MTVSSTYLAWFNISCALLSACVLPKQGQGVSVVREWANARDLAWYLM